jgi:hypothetical protein
MISTIEGVLFSSAELWINAGQVLLAGCCVRSL